MIPTRTVRLPKSLESDPRASHLSHSLVARTKPLWPGGALGAPDAQPSAALCDALRAANQAGCIVRSLEKAEQTLAAEERGQQMADRQSGIVRGVRISRLLVLANDGAERFYRRVEALLRQHGPRLIAVRLAIDARGLGEMLFGPGRAARLVLVERKTAVGAILLTLADQWGD